MCTELSLLTVVWKLQSKQERDNKVGMIHNVQHEVKVHYQLEYYNYFEDNNYVYLVLSIIYYVP